MNWKYDFYTNIGGRKLNEDSFCACDSQGCFLFVIADGLGGHECGEVASGTAISVIKEKFYDDPTHFDPEEAITDANSAIIKKQSDTGLLMKTTVTLAYISGDSATVANVGDSRTYAFWRNRIVFQTVDHSVSQLAVNVGEISQEEVRFHEDRNKLIRALGSDRKCKIDIYELDASDFDSLLLCTDGFWEYVLENEMILERNNVSDPGIWLGEMRRILNKRIPSDNDNNTAITVIAAK